MMRVVVRSEKSGRRERDARMKRAVAWPGRGLRCTHTEEGPMEENDAIVAQFSGESGGGVVVG